LARTGVPFFSPDGLSFRYPLFFLENLSVPGTSLCSWSPFDELFSCSAPSPAFSFEIASFLLGRVLFSPSPPLWSGGTPAASPPRRSFKTAQNFFPPSPFFSPPLCLLLPAHPPDARLLGPAVFLLPTPGFSPPSRAGSPGADRDFFFSAGTFFLRDAFGFSYPFPPHLSAY